MRILALDIGLKRVGVAISDKSEKIATPLCTLNFEDVIEFRPSFEEVLQDYDVEMIVCGLPKSLSGEENAQAKNIRKIASRIAERTKMQIDFFDERLSSSEAKRYLKEMGFSNRAMRGKIDSVAAQFFLQTYLDNKKQKHL